MSAKVTPDELSLLLQRHAELEAKYGDGDGGRFLSGWQCENPWTETIRQSVESNSRKIDAAQYLTFEEERISNEEIKRFHFLRDGIVPERVLCGAGASSIIFTFCAWLRSHNISEVYYIPPLYFSFHFALRLFNIRARAVSGRQAFEPNFSINLPSETTVMLFADPIWYVGVPLSDELLTSVVRWQQETKSLIFVDGSFQYAKWYDELDESTSRLDSARTVRLICPTKALASHGYRFAYALLPEAMYADCVHIYASIYGSASMDSVAFGRALPGMMLDRIITGSLMQIVSERHCLLRAQRKISAPWQPSAGYFVFEKIMAPLPPGIPLMDGSFFEQKRYPEHRRLNLLSPSMHLLG